MNILTVTRLMYFMNDKTSFWAPLSLFVGFFYLIQIQTIQRLKDERDNMLQKNQQMQRELDVLRRRRSRKGDTGFSLTFAAFAGLIGVLVGLLLSLIFSSPPATA